MFSVRAKWAMLFMSIGALAISAPVMPPLLATWAQSRIARQAGTLALETKGPMPRHRASARVATPATVSPQRGQPVAILDIPALHLNATVLTGTPMRTLALAPGWVTTTALPGQPGTAVIAAHNITFFHHLNRLQAGNHITVTTGQGRFVFAVKRHHIVKTGSILPNTIRPSLVLEACYPLNALYLTPWRYVVTAQLIASRLRPSRLPQGSVRGSIPNHGI